MTQNKHKKLNQVWSLPYGYGHLLDLRCGHRMGYS